MFEHHTYACAQALATLGGDVAALDKLRTCVVDMNDVSVIVSSQEATKLAEAEKLEGNRLFIAGNFTAARDCYTSGLRLAGAVDAKVSSQLYNNRATTNIRLKEFALAKEDAKHAAELAPQWAKPHLRLAEIYKETYKVEKAVTRLEIALGYATAAKDTALIKEAKAKLTEYRHELDGAKRRESENLAYRSSHEMEGAMLAANQARLGLKENQDPLALVDKLKNMNMSGAGLGAKKHILLGHRATQEGRLADAAREFMAAADCGRPGRHVQLCGLPDERKRHAKEHP